MAARRDPGLDWLKGLACLLMIFPHVPVEAEGWSQSLRFFGALAPVIFFGVSGATTEFQLRKRTLFGLGLGYLALALWGYLNTWIWHPGRWVADILQGIGLGVIALALLRRLCPSWCGYLIPLPFALHWLVQSAGWEAPYPIAPFLITPGNFSLAPWLSFFLLGNWSYRAPTRHLVWAAIAMTAAAAGAWAAGIDMHQKFAMSPGYFVLACALWLSLSLCARGARDALARCTPLLACGRQSLLFLFAHLFAGRILLAGWGLEAWPALKWGAAALLTAATMAAVVSAHTRWIARLRFGERWAFWFALLAGGIASAYSGRTVWLYPLGFLFATHYLELVRALGTSRPPAFIRACGRGSLRSFLLDPGIQKSRSSSAAS
ncbi:MAG TPA: hypothetical protein VF234_10860 [Limnochordia bacterium]